MEQAQGPGDRGAFFTPWGHPPGEVTSVWGRSLAQSLKKHSPLKAMSTFKGCMCKVVVLGLGKQLRRGGKGELVQHLMCCLRSEGWQLSTAHSFSKRSLKANGGETSSGIILVGFGSAGELLKGSINRIIPPSQFCPMLHTV